MPRPVTKVEVAFNVGVTGTPVWTDVTAKVRHDPGIDITHWRGDEDSETQASRCSFTLVNSDGRYTPGNTAGLHYPNIKRNRPVRVRSTHNGVTYDRFNGYVDDWSVDWPATVGSYATCTVTASSRTSRLGSGTELRTVIENETAVEQTLGHYTLGEPEGSLQVVDTSGYGGGPLVLTGDGAAVTFGTATGPPTDSLTAATFAGGRYLSGPTYPLTAASSAFLGCWFNTTTSPASLDLMLCGLLDSGITPLAPRLKLVMRPSGAIRAQMVPDAGGTSFAESAGAYDDGLTHHAIAVFIAGTGLLLYVDGILVDTSAGTLSGATATAAGGIILGGFNRLSVEHETLTGTLAHVYYGASPVLATRAADHAQAGVDGFTGETSAQWIARLASYAGVPAADVDATGTTPIAAFDMVGSTALEAMRKVETTEGGVLFDATDGTLTFRGRDDRYGSTAAFTVSYTARQVAGALQPVLDDQQQVNDMTATNALGVIGRQFDRASIDEDGLYRSSVDLETNDPDEPLMRAGWVVTRYAQASERITNIDILLDTASTALAAGVLGSRVGTEFLLSGLPSNAPASSMPLFIEGRAEQITMNEDRVSLHTSPAELWDVFTVGDAVFGQYDAYPLAY